MKNWRIDGEVILSCNCEVFCPCVVSLGRARPTHGYCHSWWGIHIRSGEAGGESLDGLKVGMLLEVPGRMGEGGWRVGLFIDQRASDGAHAALERIFTGQEGGDLGILSLLIGEVLAVDRADLDFRQTADGWAMTAAGIAECEIARQAGKDESDAVRIVNSKYWVSPEITVAVGKKSRVRALGRVWNFDRCSAEYAQVAWRGGDA